MTGIEALPRYREAWPQFNVLQANSAGISEKQVCEFVQERGHQAGQLFIDQSDSKSFSLRYWFCRPPYIPLIESQCSFLIVPAPSGIDRERFLIRCPNCERPKIAVVYKLHWQCANCHGLLHRSQIVDKETRTWERRRKLERLRVSGRPEDMSQAAFQSRLRDLKKLQEELRGQPEREASVTHSYRISHKWVAISDVEDFAFRAFYISGGEIRPVPWFEGN